VKISNISGLESLAERPMASRNWLIHWSIPMMTKKILLKEDINLSKPKSCRKFKENREDELYRI
jgi:hypothetical protein